MFCLVKSTLFVNVNNGIAMCQYVHIVGLKPSANRLCYCGHACSTAFRLLVLENWGLILIILWSILYALQNSAAEGDAIESGSVAASEKDKEVITECFV